MRNPVAQDVALGVCGPQLGCLDPSLRPLGTDHDTAFPRSVDSSSEAPDPVLRIQGAGKVVARDHIHRTTADRTAIRTVSKPHAPAPDLATRRQSTGVALFDDELDGLERPDATRGARPLDRCIPELGESSLPPAVHGPALPTDTRKGFANTELHGVSDPSDVGSVQRSPTCDRARAPKDTSGAAPQTHFDGVLDRRNESAVPTDRIAPAVQSPRPCDRASGFHPNGEVDRGLTSARPRRTGSHRKERCGTAPAMNPAHVVQETSAGVRRVVGQLPKRPHTRERHGSVRFLDDRFATHVSPIKQSESPDASDRRFVSIRADQIGLTVQSDRLPRLGGPRRQPDRRCLVRRGRSVRRGRP